MSDFRVFSFGGGVQSVAVLVLQAQGRVNYDAFVFANVGDDSENPATLRYFNDVARPYAEAHGIRLVECQRKFQGQPDSVLRGQMRRTRSALIPGYVEDGGMLTRSCTASYKIEVVQRWLRDDDVYRARIGIGFSTDEMRRVTDPEWIQVYKSPELWTIREYPLIDLGLSREACRALIRDAGLPVPPKSACWFCPFLSRSEWTQMRQLDPERFEAACQLEDQMNEARAEAGSRPVFLHRDRVPLRHAVANQPTLMDIWNDDQECGTGYCGL